MATRAGRSYQFGTFRLDATDRLLYRNGELVSLPPKVLETLLLLASNTGRVLGKDEMMKHLWPDTFVEEGTLAQYIFLLRKALGDSACWIENHPRRGYRFVAPVEEHEGDLVGLRDEKPNRTHAPPCEERFAALKTAWRFPALAVGLVIVAIAATAVGLRFGQRQNSHNSLESLAVLPFRTVSDSEANYLADGITDALITRLAGVPGLRVVSYSWVRRFNDPSRDAAQIGRQLGVQVVIEGTVRVSAGKLRLSVHAASTKNGDTLWADDRFEAASTGLLTVEKQLAEAVALRLRGRLTATERELILQPGSRNSEAYDLVLRAKAALREGEACSREAAVQYLERAVEIDPTFADAYGWLAFAQYSSYSTGLGPDTLRAAISNANQALSRNPNSPVAIRALAHIQHVTGREVEGLLMARRALDSNPNDLDATAAAAEAYFRTGLSDRAIPLYEQALRWEPESRQFRTQLSRIYFFLGKYAEGIEVISSFPLNRMGSSGNPFGLLLYAENGELDKAVRAIREERFTDPRHAPNGFQAYFRGAVLETAGHHEEARSIWTGAVQYGEELLSKHENPFVRYGLSLNYAKLGEREKAIDNVRQSLVSDSSHPILLFFAAEAHALLGNRREALSSLKSAVENGFFNLPMIEGMARSRICTLYSLRNDPEFLAIRTELARRVDELRARY